jgi:hypothetical protein
VAFVSLTSPCARCGALIWFYNPVRVPSVVVKGRREPLCRPCVEWANVERAKRGLPIWPIYPDSYDAVDEQEVPWPED